MPDEPAAAPAVDATTDALDEAVEAPEVPRRPRRSERRAESRARRRAEKQARKEARKEAREQARHEAEEQAEEQAEQKAAEQAEQEAAEQPEEEAGVRPAPAELLVARLPAINPVIAAILTGALAGLAAVLMAFGAARGCAAVRDTDSCGGGVGLLAIVAIVAIEVVIGANLLKAWQISDPFSTSFLGVGLVATIAMLFFLHDLDSVWMFLVIPLLTAAAFALSWWTTVRFIDEYDDDR